MIFDAEHKVKIETLTKTEAQAFLKFMSEEIERHEKEIQKLQGYVAMLKLHSIRQFYQSAILRHKDDLKRDYATVDKVKRMYQI